MLFFNLNVTSNNRTSQGVVSVCSKLSSKYQVKFIPFIGSKKKTWRIFRGKYELDIMLNSVSLLAISHLMRATYMFITHQVNPDITWSFLTYLIWIIHCRTDGYGIFNWFIMHICMHLYLNISLRALYWNLDYISKVVLSLIF